MKPLSIVHTEASLGWGGQEIRILTEAKNRGIPVVALPIGRKNLRGVLALRHWLKTQAVDVINTHSSTDAWLAALAMQSLGKPVPIVRTRHISAPIPHNPATRWLYQRASRHIVTTGERLREQLIGVNRFSPSAITSVPTGVDTTHFVPGDKAAARRQLGLPPDATSSASSPPCAAGRAIAYLVEVFSALPQMQGRTTLVIAHRLSTIEKADRIVVLQKGQIAEIGSHRELLAHDGIYANLHRIQFSQEKLQQP